MKKYKHILITMVALTFSQYTHAKSMDSGHAQHAHEPLNSLARCNSESADIKCAKTISATFDQQGRLWTSWTNGDFLYVNYSDNLAKTFSKPVRVNQLAEKISAHNEHRPKIKVADNGHIYLSWTVKLEKRFTGNIRFSRSVDNGKTFSKAVTVNTDHQEISHRFEALAVNKNGEIFLSWLDKRDQQLAKINYKPYDGAAAYYAVSTDQGQSFSKNIKLADHSCECCRMAIDIDNNDLPVILWRHVFKGNIRDHQVASFRNITTPEKPLRVSYDQWQIKGCPHHGPSLSIDQSNTYHAVWFNNAPERHGIFYGRSMDRGQSFKSIIPVGSYHKRASHADILSFKEQVYITWREFDNGQYKILLMHSNDAGINWSRPEVIATTSKQNDYPFLISSNNGIYISWQIPGDNYQLFSITHE